MNSQLKTTIQSLNTEQITNDRKELLLQLVDVIQQDLAGNQTVAINFICTHNSRRSIFSQAWAQALFSYYGLTNFSFYSGGTETTAVYPEVLKTLQSSGFVVHPKTTGINPIYTLKTSETSTVIELFSKVYNDSTSNSDSNFIAVLTCSQVANDCPVVQGASYRIALPFTDPKLYDNSNLKSSKYLETSMLIATELKFVAQQISKS